MHRKNTFLLKFNNYTLTNKIISWRFGSNNAYLVFYMGIIFDDIFLLLTDLIFQDDLCLHKKVPCELENELEGSNLLYLRNSELKNYKFYNSGLSQEIYYKKYIQPNYLNYKQFFDSACLYYLKCQIEKNNLAHFIDISSMHTYNKQTLCLYKHMIKLKIFSEFPQDCLNGYFRYFSDFKISSYSSIYGGILGREKEWRIFRFINGFSFYFSAKFRSVCFKDCIKTNGYIPMFIALKIYQIKLENPKITLEKLKEFYTICTFVNLMVRNNCISKKNIDKLIKTNWEYKNEK